MKPMKFNMICDPDHPAAPGDPPTTELAGADNDKMVRVRVQRSKREYLARVLRHAKRNERSKIDWMHLAERTSRYFIYLHLIVLFVSSIVIVLTVNILE